MKMRLDESIFANDIPVIGVNEKYKDLVQKVTEEVDSKFPYLDNIITSIECVGEDFVGFRKYKGAIALYDWFNHILYLNEMWFGANPEKDINDHIANKVKSGIYIPDAKVESVLYHEIGHAIARYINEKDWDVEGPFGKSIEQKVFEELNVSWEDVKNLLSIYGATNVREFFAESISEYLSSNHPRKIATKVAQIVLKNLRGE